MAELSTEEQQLASPEQEPGLPSVERTAAPSLKGPYAILDMGSNTVRLVIYNPDPPWPRILINEKVTAALGAGLADTGQLAQPNMELALEGLRRFAAIMQALSVMRLDAVATAAVRDASNGPEFIAQAEAILGQAITIASGAQEAEWGLHGVLAGAPTAKGMFADMGGGSLQIGHITRRGRLECHSFPLGALRQTELFSGNTKAARSAVSKAVKQLPWIGAGSGRCLYLVGGAWRALALLHATDSLYSLPMVHGYRLKVDALRPWLKGIAAKPASVFSGREHIKSGRQQTLPIAAACLLALIDATKVKTVQFSAYGIRQGIMFQLVFSDRIWDRPRHLLRQAARSMSQGSLSSGGNRHSEPLVDALEAFLPWALIGRTAPSKAAILCVLEMVDVGWDFHPQRRAQDVVFSVLHTQDLPLSHADRVFIAASLCLRHGGEMNDTIDKGLLALLKNTERETARKLGLCLRFAMKFSSASRQILLNSRLVAHKNETEGGKPLLQGLTLETQQDGLVTQSVTRALAKLERALLTTDQLGQNRK